MGKWMVVYKNEQGKWAAAFYDDYADACKARMDMECGLGWYSELYERVASPDQPEDMPDEFKAYEYVLAEV